MYVDKNLMIASAEDVYGSAGTQYCDYSVDLQTYGLINDIGKGKPVAVVFCVTTSFAGTTGSHITFQVLGDIDLTMDASSKIIAQSGVFDYSDLTAGTIVTVPIGRGALTAYGKTFDHIGAAVLTADQTSSAGACDVFLAFDF
jgi:hypothetical protein